jgi:integrase
LSVRKREWTTAKGEHKEAWQVAYTDSTGKRRTETFAFQKDAKDRHAEVAVEIKKGTHTPKSASPTVAEAGDKWITAVTAEDLERTTIAEYARQLKLHIVPFIGKVKLAELSMPMVADFEDKLRSEGRSPQMVKIVRTALSMLIGNAQERGLVNRNVVRERSKSRKKSSHASRHERPLEVGVDIPTVAEIGKFIAALQGERRRPLFLTAIFTGLRASELRGLRWADVDFDAKVVHVRQRADRHHKIGSPKSGAGHRTVPLTPNVLNTLRVWKHECPKGAQDLVFPNSVGKVDSLGDIAHRSLKPAMVKAGLVGKDGRPKYGGMHAFRHFYASWCINRKVDGGLELPAKVVQGRMGHSSITITLDVYGHLFPTGDDTAEMDKAEQGFFAVKTSTT